VWAGGLPGPFLVLMLVAFLTAFYMFRVVFLAFFGSAAERHGEVPAAASVGHSIDGPAKTAHHGGHEPVVPGVSPTLERHHGAHEHDPPPSMLLPLWILAALSTVLGIYSTFAGQFLIEPAEAAEHVAPVWLTPAAVFVAVAGVALAWLTYQRGTVRASTLASLFGPIRRAALAKFWIDDFFEGVLAAATLGFSRLVGWIDRYLVDGILNVVSAWTVTTGDEMRSIQTGRAQDYVYGLAVGLLLLLIWVRWSLT
jgi:NADH:ubiquinone oxidoreductase subunit 5 (subunit L)/multisubunit Na+/H+ antiporter MnhA subunit